MFSLLMNQVRTKLPETTRTLQQRFADAARALQEPADSRPASTEPLFRSPFTPSHPRVTATPPPIPMPLPGAVPPAAFVFGPRRMSSMSACAHHQAGNLHELLRATHEGDFDAAVALITGNPHLLYCKAGKQSALDDAIANDSPLAALYLARTLAQEVVEGQVRLQRVLRHAITASHLSQHCNLLASLVQALWLSEGDVWVESLVPAATSTTPVNDAWSAMHRAALRELEAQDLNRDDINDLICHGAADLVMMGLSERMAAFDPALRIPTNLFNRDERVVVALAERVDTLKGYVRTQTGANGARLDEATMLAMAELLSQANTVLGAMNQRADGTTRASIVESLHNLRELLDRPQGA